MQAELIVQKARKIENIKTTSDTSMDTEKMMKAISQTMACMYVSISEKLAEEKKYIW